MAALPASISSLNRMEAFLLTHASWRRVSCGSPFGSNGSVVDFPSAGLPRVGAKSYYAGPGHDWDPRPYVCAEKLRLGRHVHPCVPDWCVLRREGRVGGGEA
jgi:hypothetical protein